VLATYCPGVDYEQIDYQVSDRVLTITLDRPDRLNAFTDQMCYELIDAFDHADTDDEVRAIIVTGRGRGFCAGADLGAGRSTFTERSPDDDGRDTGGKLVLRIFNALKPTIAAINGPAVGIGLTMTLPMDVRFATPTAKMGMVHARRGILPEACSTWFLPRIVGISRAIEWVSTGRVFLPDEALEAGLIRAVVEPDALLARARALAVEIAENSAALSVALARQMCWKLLGADHPMAAHRLDSRGIRALAASGDPAEGVASFLEKRPPVFPGLVSRDMPAFFPWWDEPTF
jgi:enoyl-CoA hydratase/carnithine racemase